MKLPDGFSPHIHIEDMTKPEFHKNCYHVEFRNLQNVSGFGSIFIPRDVPEDEAHAIIKKMVGLDYTH